MNPVTIGFYLMLLTVTALSGDVNGVSYDQPYSANKDPSTLHNQIASKVKANVEKSLSKSRDEYISKHGLEGLQEKGDPTFRGAIDSILNSERGKGQDTGEVAQNMRRLKEMILTDIVKDSEDDSGDDESTSVDQDDSGSEDSSSDEDDSDDSTSEEASKEPVNIDLNDVANVLADFLEQKLKSLHDLETSVKGKIENGAKRHEERVAMILDHVWDKIGVALNHSKVLRENLKLLKKKIVSELKKHRWDYATNWADDDDGTRDSKDDSADNDNDSGDNDNDVLESIIDYFKEKIRAKIIQDWDSENSDDNNSDISEDSDGDDQDESENDGEESRDNDWFKNIHDIFEDLGKRISYDKTKSLLENLKGVKQRVISGLRNLEQHFDGKSSKSNESDSDSENKDDSDETNGDDDDDDDDGDDDRVTWFDIIAGRFANPHHIEEVTTKLTALTVGFLKEFVPKIQDVIGKRKEFFEALDDIKTARKALVWAQIHGSENDFDFTKVEDLKRATQKMLYKKMEWITAKVSLKKEMAASLNEMSGVVNASINPFVFLDVLKSLENTSMRLPELVKQFGQWSANPDRSSKPFVYNDNQLDLAAEDGGSGDDNDGMSDTGTAMVVIGCVALATGVAATGIVVYRKKRRQRLYTRLPVERHQLSRVPSYSGSSSPLVA